MFIAIGGPQAHVTHSMTDILFQQPARLVDRLRNNMAIALAQTFRSATGVSTFDGPGR